MTSTTWMLREVLTGKPLHSSNLQPCNTATSETCLHIAKDGYNLFIVTVKIFAVTKIFLLTNCQYE